MVLSPKVLQSLISRVNSKLGAGVSRLLGTTQLVTLYGLTSVRQQIDSRFYGLRFLSDYCCVRVSGPWWELHPVNAEHLLSPWGLTATLSEEGQMRFVS